MGKTKYSARWLTVTAVLMEYGFKKAQRACWEHVALPDKKLNLLKKDIDRVTDYYDSVRMYQYPVKGMLAVTEMSRKKWKRCILRPTQDDQSDIQQENPI